MTRKKLKHIQKRKIREECFELNDSFLKWILPRLKYFLSDASKTIDMHWEEETFFYGNTKYYFDEALNHMIQILEKWKDAKESEKETQEYASDIREFLVFFERVFPMLWW